MSSLESHRIKINCVQMEQPEEAIPLRSTRKEQLTRECIKEIFNRYDRDGNGRISITELKTLVRSGECSDLPEGFVKRLMKTSDTNNDGQLDFEEFSRMAQKHQYLFKNLCVRYCRLVVPGRSRIEPDSEYEQSMSLWPPPLTMLVFSVVQVISFVVDIIYTDDGQMGMSTNGPMATISIYNPQVRQQFWRFATYMFVHVGLTHITVNLLVQIFLGVALEVVHFWWRVALVYFAGVLAGSMGSSIYQPRLFLAGASGGVYALLAAHLASIVLNWKQMEYAVVQLFVIFVLCVFDVGSSIHNSLLDPLDRVSHIAHASGAVAGFLVGIGVFRNLQVDPWERKLWWCAVVAYSCLMMAGILYHIFAPQHFYPYYS
ncbi:rhomboid-related protein 2-like [Uranotaenia lowii]|uniref:rhomboid-related protein 2-like n=1 Tax=Uranotaenia lowii TaxID=190385 RepID=UPI002479F487|nr:rhomboid-related protein 2-like [Uranotaenia lowii]